MQPATVTATAGEPKLERNIARDERVNEALHAAGWRVIRVWERSPVDEVVSAITAALKAE